MEGSPPLTREILFKHYIFIVIFRITPAYAGNTAVCKAFGITPGDHPRLRGKYLYISHAVVLGIGSPPLTREILQLQFYSVNLHRITPAYAGNTLS